MRPARVQAPVIRRQMLSDGRCRMIAVHPTGRRLAVVDREGPRPSLELPDDLFLDPGELARRVFEGDAFGVTRPGAALLLAATIVLATEGLGDRTQRSVAAGAST